MSVTEYPRPTAISCERCGNAYEVRPKGRVPRFCSQACNQEHQKAVRRERTRTRLEDWSCDLCGVVMAVPHGCQRYCSSRVREPRAHAPLSVRRGRIRLRGPRACPKHALRDLQRRRPNPLHGGLCLDHCHTSLGVRGLLCRHCNSGLGMFRDRPDLMLRAIAYLEAA
jgi:hypothetical protein